jgi:hypothetical protein
MKKGKTTLAALTLGALTYLAWLGLDMKHPEHPEPVNTPYEMVSETAVPSVAPAPEPRRAIARTSVKIRKPRVAKAAESRPAVADSSPAPEEKKPALDVPMPNGWTGTFVKIDRPLVKDTCDLDRPCSPRGRDGVLLVGVSFSLNGYQPIAPEILSVGSYQERTPLLVYK